MCKGLWFCACVELRLFVLQILEYDRHLRNARCMQRNAPRQRRAIHEVVVRRRRERGEVTQQRGVRRIELCAQHVEAVHRLQVERGDNVEERVKVAQAAAHIGNAQEEAVDCAAFGGARRPQNAYGDVCAHIVEARDEGAGGGNRGCW